MNHTIMQLNELEQKVYNWLDENASVRYRERAGLWTASITICCLDLTESDRDQKTAFNLLFQHVWNWQEARNEILINKVGLAA